MNKKKSVAARLREYLAGDGTPNDGYVTELYCEAKGIPDGEETDLETVEQWAFDVLNR